MRGKRWWTVQVFSQTVSCWHVCHITPTGVREESQWSWRPMSEVLIEAQLRRICEINRLTLRWHLKVWGSSWLKGVFNLLRLWHTESSYFETVLRLRLAVVSFSLSQKLFFTTLTGSVNVGESACCSMSEPRSKYRFIRGETEKRWTFNGGLSLWSLSVVPASASAY